MCSMLEEPTDSEVGRQQGSSGWFSGWFRGSLRSHLNQRTTVWVSIRPLVPRGLLDHLGEAGSGVSIRPLVPRGLLDPLGSVRGPGYRYVRSLLGAYSTA